MAHVIDRAWAFLFAGEPFTVVAVRPNGVILHRPAGKGYLTAVTYYVTCEPLEWARRGEEPVTFFDEVNAGPPVLTMYAQALLATALVDGKPPRR